MTNTVLLFGGVSDERLVSVASAQNLITRFSFSEAWFIHESGALSQTTIDELTKHERPFELPFRPAQAPAFNSLESFAESLKGKTVFIALHGDEGEDGVLQAMFENKHVAFTGSGAASSRTCFDKLKAKEGVKRAGIQLAKEISFEREALETRPQMLKEFFATNGALVIKPVASGSSFGLQIVHEASGLDAAREALLKQPYKRYMMEQFIKGRELTVGVIDQGGHLKALSPSEVVLQQGRAFDYKGKYLGLGTTEITPADLTPTETKQAQEMALAAHKALGCYGYSRTDMILTSNGPVFLETNTLPGLSKASFVPQQLVADGLNLKGFVTEQLKLAGQRYQTKSTAFLSL